MMNTDADSPQNTTKLNPTIYWKDHTNSPS